MRPELAINRVKRIMGRWVKLHLSATRWDTEGDRLAWLLMDEKLREFRRLSLVNPKPHTNIPKPDLLPGQKRHYWGT